MKRAVVLLSGGLDSAVTLFLAPKAGYEPHALAFDYGQRHKRELRFARKLAIKCGADIKVVVLKLPWTGSSLLDKKMKLPTGRSVKPCDVKVDPFP